MFIVVNFTNTLNENEAFSVQNANTITYSNLNLKLKIYGGD